MNILDNFEKQMEINARIDLLNEGAKSLGSDFKISAVFSKENLPPSIVAFYQRKGLAKEAVKVIEWWMSLTPEQQRKYDR